MPTFTELQYEWSFLIIGCSLGYVIGVAVRGSSGHCGWLGLVAALVTEFGFVVTGTRDVEWGLFVSTLGGAVLSLLSTPGISVRLARGIVWVPLAAAVAYAAAVLLEASSVSGARAEFAGLIEVILMFVFGWLLYLFFRFLLGLSFAKRAGARVEAFSSHRTAAVSVGLALLFFYVLPLISASALLKVALCLYSAWVLAKLQLSTNPRLFALSLAYLMLFVGIPENAAYNLSRLTSMAMIGFFARSERILPLPRGTASAFLWMAAAFVIANIAFATSLGIGSGYYPGYGNWQVLISCVCAFGFGTGMRVAAADTSLNVSAAGQYATG